MLVNNCSSVYGTDEDLGSLPVPDTSLPSSGINPTKLNHLSAEQAAFLSALDEFAYVFTERPGLYKLSQHEIHVTPDFQTKMAEGCLRC